MIQEYAIAKVCSALGIAPQIKTDVGFDLVCYRDCIEFYTERCWPATKTRVASDTTNRLKYCVVVMQEYA